MYVSMLTAGNIGTSNANASNKFVTMAKMLHRIKNKTTTISIIAKFCCSFFSFRMRLVGSFAIQALVFAAMLIRGSR